MVKFATMLPVLIFIFAALATAALAGWRRAARAGDEASSQLAQRNAELEQDLLRLREELAQSRSTLASLTRSEHQLRKVLDLLPVPMFMKDPASRIVMMNDACEQLFGVAFAALSGTRGSAYFPPEQQETFLLADQTAFATGRMYVQEEALWNGRLRQDLRLQTFKQPLFDDDGQPSALICIAIDITERHRAKQALQGSLRGLRELSDHQENLREDERRRLARNLHDDLGQTLMALKLDTTLLHSIARDRHPRLHGHAGRVLGTLDSAIHTVRALINDLHPSTLELGLPAAVDWLLKQQERHSGMHCQLHLISDSAQAQLQPRQTWAIFRMVQEALSYIAANAKPTRLDMSLDMRATALLIIISDNGMHMERGEDDRVAAFGMQALRERVHAYGGELVSDRNAGRGATLTIMLPGKEKREAVASRSHDSDRARA